MAVLSERWKGERAEKPRAESDSRERRSQEPRARASIFQTGNGKILDLCLEVLEVDMDNTNYINKLPNEILLEIISYVDQSDLLPCGRVCQRWAHVVLALLDQRRRQRLTERPKTPPTSPTYTPGPPGGW